MIPKIIHYCWFGRNPLPLSAEQCIESWKKFLPDYEIKEWNEDNFDVFSIPYTREAYEQKKYAFVSDYARFWILYNYGGIYFDTDVQVLKKMDDFIANGPFMGIETNGVVGERYPDVAAGLGMGAYPKMDFYRKVLQSYAASHFVKTEDPKEGEKVQKTVVDFVTEQLREFGLKKTDKIQNIASMTLYPSEYMCPKNYITNVTTITEKTVTIHHYDATWWSKEVLWTRDKINKYHLPSSKSLHHIIMFFALCKFNSFRFAIERTLIVLGLKKSTTN